MFYADLALENGQDGALVDKAVSDLKNVAEDVRLLGKYYEIN
jgi:prephenate dehydratase